MAGTALGWWLEGGGGDGGGGAGRSFCAKALVLDDPGACPGGQLRTEWAKVMSSCGKMINLSLSMLYSARKEECATKCSPISGSVVHM